jgi:hypothetical protein
MPLSLEGGRCRESGGSQSQQAETPAVWLAGDTAILMRLFGAACRLSCEGSLRLKSSPPPIRMKDRLDAHGPFPAVCAPQPSL